MRATVLTFTCVAVLSVQSTPPAATTAFTGVRLLDPARGVVVDNAVVLVRNGRVHAAGPARDVDMPGGARRVDLTGKTLMPGLVAAHVHVSNVNGLGPRAYTDDTTRRQLGVYARYGVTTVVSLGGEEAPAFRAREAQSAPGLMRSRLFVAGEIVAAATPDEARAAVARVAATRPDFIKIRVDDNLGTSRKMAPATYRAIIADAHRLGLRVAAHIFYLDDAKDLLRAGVDMIAHSVRDRDIDDEFIELMRARQVPYCPTLTRELSTFVYETTPAFFDDPVFAREADPAVVADLRRSEKQAAMRTSRTAQAYKAALAVANRNLKRAQDAGLSVVMGTDSGAFAERFQGYFEHLELAMMVDAGLTPAQAIRTATIGAARALRLEAVGALTPGAWADFVVLDRNPLETIAHTRSIASVWIAGARLPPK